jgi:hypothetical protein
MMIFVLMVACLLAGALALVLVVSRDPSGHASKKAIADFPPGQSLLRRQG